MWNVPTYRIRAYVRGLRRGSQGRRQAHPFPFHYKRTRAEIALQTTDSATLRIAHGDGERPAIQASLVLNDFSPRGSFLFSAEQIQLGQRVYLTIHGPKRFFIRGRVVLCKRMSFHATTLTSGETYPYRVGILFDFQSIDERIAVKKYYDELSSKYLRSIEC